jgi:hypothetical protein
MNLEDRFPSVKHLLLRVWEYDVEIYQIFIHFQKAYDSIGRGKLFEIMKLFGIPNKLIRLIKAIKRDSTYHVKIWPMMTDGFKV